MQIGLDTINFFNYSTVSLFESLTLSQAQVPIDAQCSVVTSHLIKRRFSYMTFPFFVYTYITVIYLVEILFIITPMKL